MGSSFVCSVVLRLTLLEVLGGDARNLTITHNNQLAILAYNLLLKSLLSQQDAGINLLLHQFNILFAHISLYILHIFLYDNGSTTSLISSLVP